MEIPNKLTLDRLRYFTEAARLEHVGRAAKALHVTPSVISSAIKAIEEGMDCALFMREKQTIRLTDEGRKFLGLAQGILDSVSVLKETMGSKVKTFTGHYRIGASHFLMKQFLISEISKLQKSNSMVTFELSAVDSGLALSQLQAGLLDCALIFRSSYQQKLSELPLWSGNFQIALRKGHPLLRYKGRKVIDQLAELPAITFRTNAGQNFWEQHPAFVSLGLIPKHRFFYDDTEIAIKLLEETDGWAFLPEIIIKHDPRITRLKLSQKIVAPVNISLVLSGSEKSHQIGSVLKENLFLGS